MSFGVSLLRVWILFITESFAAYSTLNPVHRRQDGPCLFLGTLFPVSMTCTNCYLAPFHRLLLYIAIANFYARPNLSLIFCLAGICGRVYLACGSNRLHLIRYYNYCLGTSQAAAENFYRNFSFTRQGRFWMIA